MSQPNNRSRTWSAKFADAFRGLGFAIRGSSSFLVHWVMAGLVIACGLFCHVSHTEWCLLILCITIVLTAETFNSSIEFLARSIDTNHNPELGRALDTASGAVLLASVGAAIVGLAIFI